MRVWLGVSLLIFGILALAVPGFLLWASAPFWRFAGVAALWQSEWFPHEQRFGLLPAILGSFLAAATALMIAVPGGIAAALVSTEMLPRPLRRFVRTVLEVFAAIPSVVYGLLGIWLLLPALAGWFGLLTGHSLLAAGLILSLMVLPTITALSEAALGAIPNEQRETALALGLDWPQLLCRVLLPQAWPGIRSSILLALGRTLGETMAVMLVVGSLDRLPQPWWNLLQPAQTLTSRIGREIGEAAWGSLHFSALMGCATLLGVGGAMIAVFIRTRRNLP